MSQSDRDGRLKVLITGACGLLGAHLMVAFGRRHDVTGVDRNDWWGGRPVNLRRGDLTDPQFLRTTVDLASPDVLIHCAAMVDVDNCERSPSLAYRCNADLTRDLARSVPSDCLFVYVTTDGVFRGDAPFAGEQWPPCPRTVYGRAKLQGEWEVQIASTRHLIVRTNFFGWSSGRKRTFAEWLFEALEQGHAIKLFEDFFFTPLYVVDFAERLQFLVEHGHSGLFHLVGKDRVSKYDFGMMLAEEAGYSTEFVERASIDDGDLKAVRPRDMSLSSEHFRSATGFDVPRCQDGVRSFVADKDRPMETRLAALADIAL